MAAIRIIALNARSPKGPEGQPVSEHPNIKVTDNNNEVFFKIKRIIILKKLIDAFCERHGKAPNSVRFLFDGSRVQPTDSPNTLDMQDGDTLEVHREQIGGAN
ncbi:related to ubiquitin-like protein modifier [Phialocephala subalpina]|uniref:Related to ubiquitin-like protein modifier n=1 Tax=Phialocephala subalpina TaxID=576137 RepID=A0A1L7XPG4_9HELO|nr:related to ubiquitin-like protein modifier [Phialocephala subalpina]